MTDPIPPNMRRRLTGLSTGVRMLLILTIALLPLGILALSASIRSADVNRRQNELDAGTIAVQAARQIDEMVVRDARLVKAMLDRTDGSVPCRTALDQVAAAVREPDAVYGRYDARGRLVCATARMADYGPPHDRAAVDVLLLAAPERMRFAIALADGGHAAVELPIATIVRSVEGLTRAHGAVLIQGATRIQVAGALRATAFDRRVTVSTPMAGGRMALAMTVNVAERSATELLLILLPILMWLAGAIIGWLVVERLLLRPLAELERAVAGHRSGDGSFRIPRLATPAHEIRNLAEAFRAFAEDQARHDSELEEGLRRQTKLTREVHHRVKNNLQVVASLINLHARGTDEAVARAYASIQRRVDALAVVHRNHYAEMEENHGINLRTLIAELATNLRASAPAGSGLGITINMQAANVTQDVAVPVAFLVTEVIELVIDCDVDGIVAISLNPAMADGRMRLSIEAASLGSEPCAAHPTIDRFRRIIGGLARQLRAPLDYDGADGRYSIDIPVLGATPRP
ncbi:MAG: sensor histidine kinase [Sphingomonas fennica]